MATANISASPETKELYQKVARLGATGYAFGHQDTTAYGIGWRYQNDTFRSDVHDVTGDFPAVHGFDLGYLEMGNPENLDKVSFCSMSRLMAMAHENGAIVTVSWHANNPLTLKNTWDTTPVVSQILTDGSLHGLYREWLGNLAHFFNNLKDNAGNSIPVIFRPFHEMNGAWFWWGSGSCSPTEYKQLWRETFTILTQELGVENILFAYSPNALEKSEDYLKYYPGDGYVDILGLDCYQYNGPEAFSDTLSKDLAIMKWAAMEKGKPFALTEVGLERVTQADWWTKVFHPSVKGSGIAWALFWRNDRPEHHFAPYLGHASNPDFKKYHQMPEVFFLKDMKFPEAEQGNL
ncbi:MAG: glycosyl hydrolase [Sediminicola sp.]